MAKMWAGRFSKEEDSRVNDFNSSISFDCRMFKEDIAGSVAHATMLGECGIIEKEEAKAIIAGLSEIEKDIQNGRLAIDPAAEDIHMSGSYTHLDVYKRQPVHLPSQTG